MEISNRDLSCKGISQHLLNSDLGIFRNLPRAILVQWKMTKRNSSSSLLNFPLNHDGGRITKDKREGLHWNPMFFLDKTWFLHFWATQVQRVLRFFEVLVDFILHTTSSRNKRGRENHGSMVHITIDSFMKQIEKLPNNQNSFFAGGSRGCRFVPQKHHFQKLPLQWYHFLEFSDDFAGPNR